MADKWPDKDPDDTLDFAVDWSEWLGDDVIASVDWAADKVGLSFEEQTNANGVATVWLSAGTLGETYRVTCQITTEAGRIRSHTEKLKIKEK
jgi:hypothetical protein